VTGKVRGIRKLLFLGHKLRIMETGLRKQIWQRWHNPNGDSTPVFLIGKGRSGTSMVVHHLAKSWQVKLYNEDHRDAFHNWQLRDICEIEEIVRQSHARFILFKPIKDTYRTPNFLSRFPRAKVLFAFRHFNDVINSARRKFFDDDDLVIPMSKDVTDRRPLIVRWIDQDFAQLRESPPPEETKQLIKSRWNPSLNLESNIALHWIFVNRLYFDLKLDGCNRVKLINYESLVSNPHEEFRSICQFIGMEFQPRITEGIFSSSVRRHPAPEIDPVIRSDCEELWQRLCVHAGVSQESEAVLHDQQ
jgi:hypothetical protein